MVLARLAIKRAGSVGVIAFGAGRADRARAARLAARHRSRSRACSPPASAATASPCRARWPVRLTGCMTLTNRPGLVAVVSDFRDQHDWITAAAAVAARHCAFAVEVS